MMTLFENISQANKDDGLLQGLQWGIVADNDDPLKLQRLQVYDAAKGGGFKSDWLIRALPFTSYSPPVPKVGDLVAFGYIGGNPHYGVYVGVAVNQNNKPVGGDRDLTIVLGSTSVSLSSQGAAVVKGATFVTVEATNITLKGNTIIDGSLSITNASTAQIQGKQIATVGAGDTAGHTIINKGW